MFKEYSERTSIHGLQYLGEKQRSRVEKCFWIIVLTLSFSWCFFLISQIWQKWDTNPISVTFDDTMREVTDLWFPAITICPIKKVPEEQNYVYDKIMDYERTMEGNFTDDE